MDKIAVSELRANFMKVLKEVQNGSTINISSRGKIIAKLVPPINDQKEAKNKLNELGKTAKIKDVVSPIDVHWEATES